MSEIRQTTPGELGCEIEAADADGRLVTPLARSEHERITAEANTMASGMSAESMATARTSGMEAVEAFGQTRTGAADLRERIRGGEVDPAQARRELDALLAAFSAAERKAGTFEAAVATAVAIEDDQLAFAEDFYRRHPSVRPEVRL